MLLVYSNRYALFLHLEMFPARMIIIGALSLILIVAIVIIVVIVKKHKKESLTVKKVYDKETGRWISEQEYKKKYETGKSTSNEPHWVIQRSNKVYDKETGRWISEQEYKKKYETGNSTSNEPHWVIQRSKKQIKQ